MSTSRKQIRVLQSLTDGRVFPLIEGADDAGDGEQPEVEVPEGYRLVSEDAWTNIKGAADRKIDTARIARENALLKAGVPASVLDTDEGKALLNSQGIDDELLVTMAKRLAAPEPTTTPDGEETPTPPNPELTPEEQQATAERQRLAAGVQVRDDGSEVDPYQSAADRFNSEIAAGARKDVALGNAISAVMESADQRTFIPEDHAYDPMSGGVGVGYEGRA